jgi:hypothetical protein
VLESNQWANDHRFGQPTITGERATSELLGDSPLLTTIPDP